MASAEDMGGSSHPRPRRRPCAVAVDDGSTFGGAMAPTARRKRRRPSSSTTGRDHQPPTRASLLLLLACLHHHHHPPFIQPTHAAVVTWSNGPEDKFFCGFKWDEGNCATRQNCRSGRDDECEGHETHGVKCFANTDCDTKKGGAAAFVSGKYDIVTESPAPSAAPMEAVDFDALIEGGLFAPTRSPHTPGDPTPVPTDAPIGPPPPLDYPSKDPSDHWFCGVGIDDANSKCAVHCPNSNECPVGEICYFGTTCDARTHEPTPPPTRRPTAAPTTAEPTISFPPTNGPTASFPPTHFPTLPMPTTSPTPGPTQKPTHAPLTEVQGGFFCGTSWSDVTSLCKRRCPSGEDTECPGEETCFAYTGCKEEHGYGSDPSKWVPGYDEWGNSIAAYVTTMKESEAAEFANNVAETVEDDEPLCKDAEVTITSDNWPQEITWNIIDLDTGNDVVTGDNDELVANEPVSKTICLPSWGCYKFTIFDAGGDGLCCEHGNGLYQVKYGGDVVISGAAFYDSESAKFGCETEAPTRRPTKKQEIDSGSNTQYRCVANPLVDAGYVVSAELCPKFVDCYNEFIETGDSFFCNEGESCVQAEACGDASGSAPASTLAEAAEESPAKEETETTTSEAAKDETRPRPAPAEAATDPTEKPTPAPKPTNRPTELPTVAPTTDSPSASPTTSSPTLDPTETPTDAPTLGPCGGDPCPQSSHCRSRYGFCGPGENYCTDTAVWSIDCKFQPTQSPATPPTLTPSTNPATSGNALDVFPSPSGSSSDVPAFQKPSGGGKPKPTGGKKPTSGSKPAIPAFQTRPPTMDPVTKEPTPEPTPRPTRGTPAGELVDFHILSTPSPSRESDVPEYSDLTTDSELELMTNPPTPRPTKPSSKVNGATAASPTATATASAGGDDDYSCTGEPCEVETWCRSRYGSCGPGFIYCNTYSTWKKTCPPVPPGTRPTRRPTPRPTREPSKAFVASTPSAPTAAREPTLPPLPKPTLPWITSGGQTYLAAQASGAQSGARPSASWDGMAVEEDSDDDEIAEKDDSESADGSWKEAEESYTGLDQWIQFTEGIRNSGTACCRTLGSFAVAAATLILSCIVI